MNLAEHLEIESYYVALKMFFERMFNPDQGCDSVYLAYLGIASTHSGQHKRMFEDFFKIARETSLYGKPFNPPPASNYMA